MYRYMSFSPPLQVLATMRAVREMPETFPRGNLRHAISSGGKTAGSALRASYSYSCSPSGRESDSYDEEEEDDDEEDDGDDDDSLDGARQRGAAEPAPDKEVSGVRSGPGLG